MSRTLFTLLVFQLIVISAAHAQTPEGMDELAVEDRAHMPEARIYGVGAINAKIVLLRMGERFEDETWRRAEERTAAELRALGFEVATVSAHAESVDDRVAELRAAAHAQQAAAAIRIVNRGRQRQVVVWLYDALTDKTLLRQSTIGMMDADSATQVALRATELVYASLVELRLPGREPTEEAVPALVDNLLDERLATSSEERPWSAWLGGGIYYFPDSFGAAPMLNVGFGHEAGASWFMVGVESSFPLWPASARSQAGKVDALVLHPRVTARVSPWPRAEWSPSLALQLGALVASVAGEGTGLYQGRSEWAAAFTATVDLRLDWRLQPEFGLFASVAVTAATTRIVVRSPLERVGTIGDALMRGELGVAWAW